VKNCPHCQFLVHDGADTCGVCKQPIAVPQQPAGPWGADPGFLPGGGTATATATQARPTTFVNPSPPRRPVSGLKVATIVVACIVALGAVGVAALMFLGQQVDQSVDPASTAWSTHRDPEGAFSVDVPGSVEVIDDLGATAGTDLGGIQARGVIGSDGGFGAAVFRYGLPPGSSFDTYGAIEGMAVGSFTAPTVTSKTTVETAFGPGIDAEVVGTLSDGQKGIAFVRGIQIDGVPYLIGTYGYAAWSPEVQQLHQHLLDSFQAPAAP
jgi:hypothetical protein